MPDLFSDITKAPPDVLEAIVKTLELRAADPQLRSSIGRINALFGKSIESPQVVNQPSTVASR